MNKKITIIGIILCAIGIAMYSYINLGIEIIIIITGIITIICGIFKSKNNINEEEVTSNELNNDNDKFCHNDIKYKSYVSVRSSTSSKVYTYLSDPNHPLSTGECVNIMGNTGIEKVHVVKGDTLLPENVDLKYKEIKVIEEATSNELNTENDKSCYSDIKYKSYVSVRFSASSKVYTYLSDPNHPLSTGERVNIMGNTGIEKVYVVKGDTLLPEKNDLKYKEIKVIEEEKSGDNFFDKYY